MLFRKILLLLGLLVLLPGCDGQDKDAVEDKYIFNMSHVFNPAELAAIGLQKVADNVLERTNGRVEIRVFPSNQIPAYKDNLELVVSGANWIAVEDLSFLGDYVPDAAALAGPFLYQSYGEYLALMHGDYVADLKEALEGRGIKLLSLDFLFGFRHMVTNKDIQSAADMKGMKVRVPASKIYIDTLSAMGASPSGLPFGETFSAVQQGVVDGLDGSIATIYGTKVYEVAKKVAMTQHILGSLGVYISPQSWAKLPPELQEIVQEEFDKGAIENNQTLYRLEQEYMKELVQDHGMTFTEVNLDEFGEMTKGVYDRFPGWSKGVRDTMLAEIKKLHESGEVAKAQAIMEGSNE